MTQYCHDGEVTKCPYIDWGKETWDTAMYSPVTVTLSVCTVGARLFVTEHFNGALLVELLVFHKDPCTNVSLLLMVVFVRVRARARARVWVCARARACVCARTRTFVFVRSFVLTCIVFRLTSNEKLCLNN